MPNLSLQFFRKSMMQEVLPPSSCRDISISCRSRYFSIRHLSWISWFIDRAFENVKRLFIEEAHRSFIKRYLKRNDIMCNISSCDAILTIGIGHVPVVYHHLYILVTMYSSLFQFAFSSKLKNCKEIDILKFRLSSLPRPLKGDKDRTPSASVLLPRFSTLYG